MIAGKARATKLLVLVAIALAVLAYLVIRAAEAPKSHELPNPPLHTHNYFPGELPMACNSGTQSHKQPLLGG